MVMCYNPQMSCDAIEKHNYGLKLLREIKQVGVIETIDFNLVPRVFSLSNMAAAGEKTLAHSRNHVTDFSTESGNLFKMAAR